MAKRIASSAILAARKNPFKRAREKGKGRKSRAALSRRPSPEAPSRPIVGVRNEGVRSEGELCVADLRPRARVCVYVFARVCVALSTCARTAEGGSGGSGSGGGEKEEGNRIHTRREIRLERFPPPLHGGNEHFRVKDGPLSGTGTDREGRRGEGERGTKRDGSGRKREAGRK